MWKFDKVLTKTNLLSFFWDTVYKQNFLPPHCRLSLFDICILQSLWVLIVSELICCLYAFESDLTKVWHLSFKNISSFRSNSSPLKLGCSKFRSDRWHSVITFLCINSWTAHYKSARPRLVGRL